jgi:hypothetical protein
MTRYRSAVGASSYDCSVIGRMFGFTCGRHISAVVLSWTVKLGHHARRIVHSLESKYRYSPVPCCGAAKGCTLS